MRTVAFVLLLAALPAAAVNDATWPPPGDTAVRMRELQQVITAPGSTPAQRDSAREELGRMLMSPAGQGRPLPDATIRKPRAAIDPYPSLVRPVNIAPAVPPPAGVARIEVIEPARPGINPRTGSIAVPIQAAPIQQVQPPPAFAIDPRTGSTLHPSGTGYVDPRTGQVSR